MYYRKSKTLGKGMVSSPGVRISSVSFSDELFEAVRTKAVAEDRSVSNMIAVLVRRALKAEKQ